MGRFNRTQNELEQERQARAELESRLQAPTKPEENDSDVPDNDAIAQLQAQVASLAGLITENQQKEARTAVLDAHPEVKPLAGFITGADSIEEYTALVEQLSTAIKSAGGEAPVATATADPATADPATSTVTPEGAPAPEAPVAAGGTTFSGEAALEEKVTEAIQKGDFGAFFRARTEQAESQLVG